MGKWGEGVLENKVKKKTEKEDNREMLIHTINMRIYCH